MADIAARAPTLFSLPAFCEATGGNVTFDGKIGWYTGGNSRSTFDIIWSCVAVILACTYKVIHLNIPPEEPAWQRWRRRFKWMGWMALSPEILLSMAMRDWLYARDSARKLSYLTARPASEGEFGLCRRTTGIFLSKENSRADDYSLTPSIEMKTDAEHVPAQEEVAKQDVKVEATATTPGVAKSHEMLVKRPASSKDIERAENHHIPAWTTVHALYAEMGGYVLTFHKAHPPIPIFSDQIRVLIEEFNFEIPLITKDDINDRSKADPFTKAFAIIQSSWLVVNSIARTAQGLPITELELATMGFVSYALVMYLLWWQKPFETEYTVSIHCPHENRHEIIARMRAMFERRYTSKFLAPTWDVFMKEQRVRNWAYMDDLGLGRQVWLVCTLSILFVGMAFSALHLAAWNWEFPTQMEQYLWRSAALTATVATIPVAILLPTLGLGAKTWQKYTVLAFVYPICGVYLLCRGILIVQVFLCFRAMPAKIYEDVQWTYFLPRLT